MHQSLLARVYLRNDEFEKVFEVYDRVCPKAEAGNRISRVVELSLFKAVALWELGQKDEAISLFEECLLHAERDGIVRLFLETGETVVQLLQRVKSKGGRTEYIGKLESAFNDQQFEVKDDAPIIPPQEGLIEPLTKRELQVLRLMCEGQSNQEIADEMIVSVNTVKKHTSNIYGKLGVRNRAQAVLRAREIELV
jgi:LuxR family maltose regulon positive regulatory protein